MNSSRKPPISSAFLFAFFALSLAPGALAAQEVPEPTRVTVRAVAKGAKIIGDGVGGAMIRVVDAETGATLAEGTQNGGTGDTERIMRTPRTRDMTVYDTPGAARFVAELAITEPTIVNVSARGPLGYPQAIQASTKRMVVVPGSHVDGDGVVLTLHGFIVDIQMPEPMAPLEGSVEVTAEVQMMCGCPLTPGGLWDADQVEIEARLLADGEIVSETALEYAGQASTFTGELSVPAGSAGRDLELEVVASNPDEGNAGRHVIPVAAGEAVGR